MEKPFEPFAKLGVPTEWLSGHGLEVCAMGGDVLVVAHRSAGNALLFEQGLDGARGRPVPLSHAGHVELRPVDGSRVSYLSEDRRQAVVFDLGRARVHLKTALPFPAGGVLAFGDTWIAARLVKEHLFHRVSMMGECTLSFGSTQLGDQYPRKRWTPGVPQGVAFRGILSRLADDKFVFCYDALPILEAYDIEGHHLWTTILQDREVRSVQKVADEWENIQRQNPKMQVGLGLLASLNADLAVGRYVAILHRVSSQSRVPSVSVLETSGRWLETVPLERQHSGIVWHGGQLLAVRVEDVNELRLDRVLGQYLV